MDNEEIKDWLLKLIGPVFSLIKGVFFYKRMNKLEDGQKKLNERMNKIEAAYCEAEKILTLAASLNLSKETENLYNTGFLSSPKPSYNPFQDLELQVSVAQAAQATQIADNWKSLSGLDYNPYPALDAPAIAARFACEPPQPYDWKTDVIQRAYEKQAVQPDAIEDNNP